MRTTWAWLALAAALAGAAHAEGDLVVTAKWETQGSDIDLGLIGPDMTPIKPEKDVTSGPGQETCTVKAPQPGVYLVGVFCAKAKEGEKTPVTVEVRLGDKAETTHAVVDTQGEGKIVRTVAVGDAKLETTPLGAGDLTVTLKWETPGADVDLGVLPPNMKPVKPAQDVTTGPGQETVTIQAPKPGLYLVAALCSSTGGAEKIPVTAEVKVGGTVVGTFQATLEKQGEPRIVRILQVGEAPK